MIEVVIDSEMRDAFREKACLVRFREGGRIRPVESIQYTGRVVWHWEEVFSWGTVFKSGDTDIYQYDEEFTEWLKEHRPEVFL